LDKREIDLSIIVPCYNEEQSLPSFLPSLLHFCRERNWKIILINDGSTDNSKQILRLYDNDPRLTLIHHKVNRGYGGAIKSGIKQAQTEYIITIDGDGQHYFEDIEKLVAAVLASDADMVIGSRKSQKEASWFRGIGKYLIRTVAKIVMPVTVYDINSGMKLCRTTLAQKFIHLCPDGMSFSDILTLVFINNKNLVIEESIKIKKRSTGKSTINISTAFQTVYEIINIIVLFNPIKIFLSLSLFFLLSGVVWGIPIVLKGRGVSTGSLLALIAGILFFILGLLAEQLSNIRKTQKSD